MYFRKNWIFFIKFHSFWFFFFFFVWIFSNIIHIYDLPYLCIDCNICLHWNHCLRIYVTIWNFYEKEREKVGESERDTVKGWEREQNERGSSWDPLSTIKTFVFSNTLCFISTFVIANSVCAACCVTNKTITRASTIFVCTTIKMLSLCMCVNCLISVCLKLLRTKQSSQSRFHIWFYLFWKWSF